MLLFINTKLFCLVRCRFILSHLKHLSQESLHHRECGVIPRRQSRCKVGWIAFKNAYQSPAIIEVFKVTWFSGITIKCLKLTVFNICFQFWFKSVKRQKDCSVAFTDSSSSLCQYFSLCLGSRLLSTSVWNDHVQLINIFDISFLYCCKNFSLLQYFNSFFRPTYILSSSYSRMNSVYHRLKNHEFIQLVSSFQHTVHIIHRQLSP